MARPRSFDTDEMISVIKETFWVKGYAATSLEDLVKATGLKKGSLYAAFGDKTSMYCLAVAQYDADEVAAGIAALNLTPNETPFEGLNRLLSAAEMPVAEHGDRRGCFLCNASSELGQLPEPAARQVVESRDRLRASLNALLAQHPALKSQPSDCQAKADEILAVYFGLRVLARSGLPVDDLARIRRSALAPFKI